MSPIKGLPELQGISREHHDGLLLSWKIRAGTAKGVAPARICGYCRRFLREQRAEIDRAYAEPHSPEAKRGKP